VVPQSGAWWAGYHGVYFFKEVKGDFAITTRVKVTGKSGGDPAKMWTISGLLVRAPASSKIPREQRKENWIYLMTGRGPGEGRVIDAKSTLESNNAWDITPAQPGWYESPHRAPRTAVHRHVPPGRRRLDAAQTHCPRGPAGDSSGRRQRHLGLQTLRLHAGREIQR